MLPRACSAFTELVNSSSHMLSILSASSFSELEG